ncbi:unnamed protein product [Clonostachys rhizophaga]|uniref:Uncharacterized protein n=1 Tax=Clonostachys rhizophaga TaxID=160324 RepID=A0A9N9VTZ2_9HYPO|nr:unnamed protein product [Clonostachys rhizophaga]
MGRGGGTGGEVGLLQPPRGAARGPGQFLILRWASGNGLGFEENDERFNSRVAIGGLDSGLSGW